MAINVCLLDFLPVNVSCDFVIKTVRNPENFRFDTLFNFYMFKWLNENIYNRFRGFPYRIISCRKKLSSVLVVPISIPSIRIWKRPIIIHSIIRKNVVSKLR